MNQRKIIIVACVAFTLDLQENGICNSNKFWLLSAFNAAKRITGLAYPLYIIDNNINHYYYWMTTMTTTTTVAVTTAETVIEIYVWRAALKWWRNTIKTTRHNRLWAGLSQKQINKSILIYNFVVGVLVRRCWWLCVFNDFVGCPRPLWDESTNPKIKI